MFGEIVPSGSPASTSIRESTPLASLAHAVAEFFGNSSALAAPTEPRKNSRRPTMPLHLAWKVAPIVNAYSALSSDFPSLHFSQTFPPSCSELPVRLAWVPYGI